MVNEKRVSVQLLAVLASNPIEWKKQYGNKTLAEVLAKDLTCEELCNAGVEVDKAVDLKGTSRFTRKPQIRKTQRAEAVVETSNVSTPKKVVLHKADGSVITRKLRGGKYVVSHKETTETKTSAPKTRFVKSKGGLDSKLTHKKMCVNGEILDYVYRGEISQENLVQIVHKGRVNF